MQKLAAKNHICTDGNRAAICTSMLVKENRESKNKIMLTVGNCGDTIYQ